MTTTPRLVLSLMALLALRLTAAATPVEEASKEVTDLDTAYQAAVARNDATTMDRILGDDFVLVLGNGSAHPKAELLETARHGDVSYTIQAEEPGTQTVRVWGDTAVVTALLRLKGMKKSGQAFDRRLWFSDTYVRTPAGWRYVFGQASLPLPAEGDQR